MNRIDELRNDPDLSTMIALGKDVYFIHWSDGSGGFYDRDKNKVSPELTNYDFITEFTKLGELDGHSYYAFIARDYAWYYHDTICTIINEKAQRVEFKNRNIVAFSEMHKLQQQFAKLQQLSEVYKSQGSRHKASEQLVVQNWNKNRIKR